MNWASDLGCQFTSDRVVKHQTRITNRLGWTTSLSGIGIATFLCTTPTPALGLLYIYFISILMLLPVYLNSRGKHKTARLFYVLIANFIVASLSVVFGKDSHFQYFFFTLVGIPIIFFSTSKSRIKWFFSIGAVMNWIAVEIWFLYNSPMIDLGPALAELFRWLSNGVQFLLIALMFYFFAEEFERFVTDLKLQHSALQNTNKQLDRALEKSKEATKAKSMFLANMSHEIRTPLNGIIVASDLLRTSNLQGQEKEFSQIIHSSSRSLLSIVNDVLDLSKAEANKIEIEQAQFSLEKLVKDIVKTFGYQAFEKRIDFYADVHPELKAFYIGDELRIKQVLNNLLGNAIKFCQEGHIFLKVEPANQQLSDRSLIRFTIEDTGIGISQDKLNEIFESFTQEDGSTSRTYGGTGLGTTISKMLVELMGGETKAISPNPNNEETNTPGSVFSFTVALKEASQVSIYPKKKLTKENLWVMTNNTTTRAFMNTIGQRMNASMRFFENSKAIAEALKQASPDVVFCDGSDVSIKTLNFPNATSIVFMQSVGVRQKPCPFAASINRPLTNMKIRDVIFYDAEKEQDGSYESVVFDEAIFTGKRVLLAEDNPVNQEVAKHLFKNMGCEIVIAEDGVEALELIKGGEFDLIFMDHMMPNMDGIEASKVMRERGINLPIIAMTANTLQEHKEMYFEAGINDYISKPVIIEKLTAVISKWIS